MEFFYFFSMPLLDLAPHFGPLLNPPTTTTTRNEAKTMNNSKGRDEFLSYLALHNKTECWLFKAPFSNICNRGAQLCQIQLLMKLWLFIHHLSLVLPNPVNHMLWGKKNSSLFSIFIVIWHLFLITLKYRKQLKRSSPRFTN